MSDDITPALTPEQWDEFATATPVRDVSILLATATGTNYFARNPHLVAALCLFGQSFGFTHEDVEALQIVLNSAEIVWNVDAAKRCESLAARLASLLPPKP